MRFETMKYIIGLVVFLSVFSRAGEASLTLESHDNKMRLEVRDTMLQEILDEIWERYQVQVVGLEHREEERITFSASGKSLDDLLKRLFRYMGEVNYAFEYSDVKLVRVSVLPRSDGKTVPLPPSYQKSEHRQKKFGRTVQVKDVIKGSQAEELGLQKDDLIIEYDGVKINSAQQLVKEVKKKSDIDQVDMTVVRDKIPIRYVLKGGRIGVRIITHKLPQETLDNYY